MARLYPTKQELEDTITKALKKSAQDRKVLILKVIETLGYEKDDLKDTSCESLSSKLKSLSGIVINDLLEKNVIFINTAKKIELKRDEKPVVSKTINAEKPQKQTKSTVLPLTKKQITDYFVNKYLSKDDLQDASSSGNKNNFKAILGNIISKYWVQIIQARDPYEYVDNALRSFEHTKNIVERKNLFFPNSELGKRLEVFDKVFNKFKEKRISEVVYKKELEKAVLEVISLAGGEFFEQISMKIILNIYKDTVVDNELTAGPNDNGIDGKIYTQDSLGFKDTIFIQSKTKIKEHATVATKVVREFIGVMTAYNATRGIIISNSGFHSDAVKLKNKVTNLLLIDKNQLLELMKKTTIGLKKVDDITTIDYECFLLSDTK